MSQAIETVEWTAVCSSRTSAATGCVRVREIKVKFRDAVPQPGERLPLPAGFYVVASGRRQNGITTEIHTDAANDHVETLLAWLADQSTAKPANIVSYECETREGKLFPRRGAR